MSDVQGAKKIATGITGDIQDVTDNDPIDPGQQYLTHVYDTGNVPTKDDYKFAKKISNNRKNKYFVAILVANFGFWIYMILDYISDFLGG